MKYKLDGLEFGLNSVLFRMIHSLGAMTIR